MRLKSEASVLNFGDTSFRRKEYLSEYRILLKLLSQHMSKYKSWIVDDRKKQSVYYETVLDKTDIFNRALVAEKDYGQRARTLTNSIVKTGLIDSSREISEVGEAWLNHNLTVSDEFERLLGLSEDNLVFFRQWSKFRVYDAKEDVYFSPFLFILKFLSKNEKIVKSDLIKLIHSIDVKTSENQLNSIINSYQTVVSGELNFDEFLEKYVNQNDAVTEKQIDNLLSGQSIDQNEFNKYFYNGKSQNQAGPIYLKFVENLLIFRRNHTAENLTNLLNSAKVDKNKKAFGYGTMPFVVKKSKAQSIANFLDDNQDSVLLNGSLFNIYQEFKSSKRNDLVKEYGDLTYRLTNLAGVISYNNNLVELPLRSLFAALFANAQISLRGEGKYDDYEGSVDGDSVFFKNKSFMSSIGINKLESQKIISAISAKFSVDDLDSLQDHFEKEKDIQFRHLVADKFPKQTVIQLLKYFQNRDDKSIREFVTDNAPIADIFEYVVGLLWYHFSNGDVNVRKAYKMSLDADFLPLSHAPGYQGNVELNYSNKTVLLEATLMDKSTQKRGEMEPVIRHTTNLKIEKQPKPVQTIFVAKELSENVLNVFRSVAYIDLGHSSQENRYTHGVNIFALNLQEAINLLELGVSDEKILKSINDHFNDGPEHVYNGWRKPILDQLMKSV